MKARGPVPALFYALQAKKEGAARGPLTGEIVYVTGGYIAIL